MTSWSNRDLLCGYFRRGICTHEAQDCVFSHDQSSAIIPDNACLFFLRSNCRNGQSCRFQHLTASDICSKFYGQSNQGNNSEEVPSVSTPQACGTSSKKPVLVPFRSEPPVPDSRTKGKDATKSNMTYAAAATEAASETTEENSRENEPLCPFSVANFECPNQSNCHYLHGLLCDLCNRSCLHPFNEKAQKQHRDECVKEHERQMELSFAIQRSMDKSCGICMDTVMEKEPIGERRFGVLEKCTHIFCLSCIRKWRQTKQFDSRTIRSCPECRVSSDFVVPSEFWVESKEDKDKLIEDYKNALGSKDCKYFKQGRGECPFAGACFYRHAYPDGTKATMPPPRARRVRTNADGERESLMDVLLWNYLEQRDDRNWMMSMDFDELLDMRDFGLFSTDDDSDFSDYFGDDL